MNSNNIFDINNFNIDFNDHASYRHYHYHYHRYDNDNNDDKNCFKCHLCRGINNIGENIDINYKDGIECNICLDIKNSFVKLKCNHELCTDCYKKNTINNDK